MAALTVALSVLPLAAPATAATGLLVAGTGAVQPSSSAGDVDVARAELDAVTERAAVLATALEQAAARDGGLRQALDDLAAASDVAQARLDARVRQVFIRGGPDPLGDLVVRLGSPAVPRAARQGLSAAVRAEREMVDAASVQGERVRALQARAQAFRAGLRQQARDVLVAQDRARTLLADAEARAVARARARAAADRAASAVSALTADPALGADAAADAALAANAALAADAALAVERARLAVVASRLDAVSAAVTRSLSPARTARGRRAQEREAPLVALAEAAGSGYPQGWGPTGVTVSGTASWYGPGFVGSPTASGAPYDPERLTCAHKALPLGTLLRVSRDGRAVNCLVNDRGPFVGDRVLDLSRAGSRALGYDGTAQVVAEVLAPQ